MSAFEGGKGGGPTPWVNSFKPNTIASLRYNTSQAGAPVPIVYGTQRCSVNLLELWGQSGGLGQNTNAKGKGGKGGASKGNKKGSGNNYAVDVCFGVCQGPVSYRGSVHGFTGPGSPPTYNPVWANGSVAGSNDAGLNFYAGNDGQAPVFDGSDPDTPLLGYSGTSVVTGTPMQLGSSPALPNIGFLVTGFFAGTSGASFPDDASPAQIVIDLLTNSRYGAGFPAANLDSAGTIANWGTYCQAAGLAMSVVLDRQQPCARWIEEIAQLTVSAVVWSGSLLKIIPYGDIAIIDNFYASWTPNLVWQYSLTDLDYLDAGSADPVTITRSDPSAATNWLSLEWQDAGNNYNPAMMPVWDQGLIDQYGTRTEAAIQAHEFTNATSAAASAQLQLQRKGYIRNTFKFKLGWRYSLLEPMDIVLLTDATTGLWQTAVRITQIDEDDNGELAVTAEDIPGVTIGDTIVPSGAGTAASYPKQDSAGSGINILVNPPNTNVPIIFEPPGALTSGQRQVWLIASGGADWGGCQVWVSLDGTSYAQVDTITVGGRQGVLTANLPSHADPDTTDTLSVDLTESQGQLLSGTQADADALLTLCYCDGELVSYETATLTASYKYNLTYLRRGAYGTPIAAHSSGAPFARFSPTDPSVAKNVFPGNYVGQTLYVKLPAFNQYGLQLQSLAGLTVYTYGLTGEGAGEAPFLVTGSQSGPTTASLVIERFVFTSTCVFAGNFGQVYALPGATSQGVAAAAATAQAVYTIAKNGVAVGTMTFGAGATTASFAQTAASVAFNAGDVLTIVAPSSPDATLAGLAWTLAGNSGGGAVDEFHSSQSGVTTANLVVARWAIVDPVSFPAALATSAASAGVAATASATYSVQKNGVQFATLNFAAAATTATFAGSATILNAGDVLTIVAPATPDATLADIAFSLAGASVVSLPTPYIAGAASGAIAANLVVQRYVFDAPFAFAAGLGGSVGIAASAGVGSTTFAIEKNGVAVGSMSFAGGATTATFAMAAATAFAAGDVLTIVAPAAPDAALSGLAWGLAGS